MVRRCPDGFGDREKRAFVEERAWPGLYGCVWVLWL